MSVNNNKTYGKLNRQLRRRIQVQVKLSLAHILYNKQQISLLQVS